MNIRGKSPIKALDECKKRARDVSSLAIIVLDARLSNEGLLSQAKTIRACYPAFHPVSQTFSRLTKQDCESSKSRDSRAPAMRDIMKNA